MSELKPPFESSSSEGPPPSPPSPPQAPTPSPQAPPPPSSPWPYQQPKRPFWRRVLSKFGLLVLVLSLLMNVYLMVVVGKLIEGPLETTVLEAGREDQVVAVYEVSGVIDGDQAEQFRVFCRHVGGDANVKAVVLRVNSPGGCVSACDRIHRQMEDLKAKGKKLVVSMGSTAASGGYYISVPADAIYAEPTTTTGSIGVLRGWMVLKGTLEKIGAKVVIVRSTKTQAWKAARNPFEDTADYHIEETQKALDVIQERFEGIVRRGRGSKLIVTTATKKYTGADGKEFEVEETVPFNGKVFLGAEAKSLGLVDKVGYQDEAIKQASRLAGLSDPKVVKYAERKGLLEGLGLAQAGPVVNLKVLDEIQTPRMMMIWKVSP